MPNHCDNDLVINGANVPEVLGMIKSVDDDKCVLDFNRIIPYPEEFKVLDVRENNFKVELQAIDRNTPDSLSKLIDLWTRYDVPLGTFWIKDGFSLGGLHWCKKNWGTKWNSYEGRVLYQSQTEASLNFLTAWSPPIPVIARLASIFPDYRFDFNYYEQGAAFCGHNKWVLGKQTVETFDPDYRGGRGG